MTKFLMVSAFIGSLLIQQSWYETSISPLHNDKKQLLLELVCDITFPYQPTDLTNTHNFVPRIKRKTEGLVS